MSTLLIYRSRVLAQEAVAAATALSLQQQRSQEQAMFLGMLAHEFKTPLSVLKIVVDSGQLDSDLKTFSADAIRNIDALLDKCLQTETLMDATVVTDPVLLDLEGLLRDVVNHNDRRQEVVVDIQGPTEIRSDPAMVHVVLANMFDNAMKYGKAGAGIKVNLYTAHGDYIAVRVTNAVGKAGVPDVNQVFDKYYRAAGALSQSGSGLGLYLSKNIARLLGGDLLFEPGDDELWFELRLPRQI